MASSTSRKMLLWAAITSAGCASPATGTVAVTPPAKVPAISESPAAPAPAPPKPAAAPPSEPAAPTTAPPPFDAAAIRGATKLGRTYVFLVKAGTGPQTRRKVEFIAVSDAGPTTRSTNQDLFGHPKGDPEEKKGTWEDLVAHATYPAAATTITEAKVKVPAGTYDCKLYTVKETKDGKEQVTQAWFAKSLPGAPVKHVVSVGGKPVSTMELFQHKPGR